MMHFDGTKFLTIDQEHLNSFELTRRVTPSQWENVITNLSRSLAALHQTGSLVSWYTKFKVGIHSSLYISKIGEDRDFPYRILYAVNFPKGHPYHISVKTFATLMLFWQVMQENPWKVDLVDVAEKHKDDFVESTLFFLKKSCVNFKECEKELFESLKKKKTLSRCVASFRPECDPKGVIERITTVGGAFLFFMKKENFRLRLMPSISIVDQLLKNIFRHDAILSNPVLGDSTPEDLLRSQKKGRRDLQIFFPGIEVPEVADTYKVVAPTDFSLHDIYHLYIGSYCLKPHRKIIIDLIDNISKLNELDEARNLMIDGGASIYKIIKKEDFKDSDDAFWVYICSVGFESQLDYQKFSLLVAVAISTVGDSIKDPNPEIESIIKQSSEKFLRILDKRFEILVSIIRLIKQK